MSQTLLPTIVFVTGNQNKLKEVGHILEGAAIVRGQKIDLPELQGEAESISRTKACEAFRRVGCAALVEDVCLGFDAMKGLPGPYIKWFLDKLGPEGLSRMLAGYDDKSASALCTFALAFSDEEKDCLLFVGEVRGTLVSPRGGEGFGWDSVFQPKDADGKTYAEMTAEEKNAISHRGRGLQKLKEWIAVPENAAKLMMAASPVAKRDRDGEKVHN